MQEEFEEAASGVHIEGRRSVKIAERAVSYQNNEWYQEGGREDVTIGSDDAYAEQEAREEASGVGDYGNISGGGAYARSLGLTHMATAVLGVLFATRTSGFALRGRANGPMRLMA